LTPDGKYFIWSGPRMPPGNSRCEVWDVAAGTKPIVQHWPDTSPNAKEVGGSVTPDGLFFYVTGSDNVVQLYDLRTGAKVPNHLLSPWYSQDMQWTTAYPVPDVLGLGPTIPIRPSAVNQSWVEFFNYDSSSMSHSIYRDGRYLAWTDESGGVTVANIRELQETLASFERETLSQ
jgi:hypothetical protein